MKRSTIFALLLACLLQFSTARANATTDDILTTAAKNGSFSTLIRLVIAAGLNDELQSKGEFTVFAPSDEAFAKLPPETLESLLRPENREQLIAILKYHVLGKELSIAKKRRSHLVTSATTLSGAKVSFERTGNEVSVNDSKVVARNIRCSNGLIHVIDGVLMPPSNENTIVGVAQSAGSFKTLLAAAEAAGLVDALNGEGPLTVFAPSEKAFAKLPKQALKDLLKPENKAQLVNILKYHVVSGRVSAQQAVEAGRAKTLSGDSVEVLIRDGRLSINQARVTKNDVDADNGVIHIIDQVLMPPASGHTSITSDRKNEITITATWRKPVKRDGIVADRVNIRCSGGGSVRLTNLKSKEVVTLVAGGGAVTIEGETGNHRVNVSGGGVLRARDLVTHETKVTVNGGGQAEVNAVGKLDAAALAGARIRYVDTGATIHQKINKYATFGPLTREATHH